MSTSSHITPTPSKRAAAVAAGFLTVLLPFPFKCKPLSKSGEDTRLWSEGGPGDPEGEGGETKGGWGGGSGVREEGESRKQLIWGKSRSQELKLGNKKYTLT